MTKTLCRAVLLAAASAATLAAQSDQKAPMTAGGEVAIRRVADNLHVTVTGPRAGIASLCVGDETRVRILHASAAVGEAVYENTNGKWVLTEKFAFALRNTRTGPPSQADKDQFFKTKGWVSDASNSGTTTREFIIHLIDRIRFLGVTHLSMNEPMAVTAWPSSMNDDCNALKMVQGYLPEQATFNVSLWHKLP